MILFQFKFMFLLGLCFHFMLYDVLIDAETTAFKSMNVVAAETSPALPEQITSAENKVNERQESDKVMTTDIQVLENNTTIKVIDDSSEETFEYITLEHNNTKEPIQNIETLSETEPAPSIYGEIIGDSILDSAKLMLEALSQNDENPIASNTDGFVYSDSLTETTTTDPTVTDKTTSRTKGFTKSLSIVLDSTASTLTMPEPSTKSAFVTPVSTQSPPTTPNSITADLFTLDSTKSAQTPQVSTKAALTTPALSKSTSTASDATIAALIRTASIKPLSTASGSSQSTSITPTMIDRGESAMQTEEANMSATDEYNTVSSISVNSISNMTPAGNSIISTTRSPGYTKHYDNTNALVSSTMTSVSISTSKLLAALSSSLQTTPNIAKNSTSIISTAHQQPETTFNSSVDINNKKGAIATNKWNVTSAIETADTEAIRSLIHENITELGNVSSDVQIDLNETVQTAAGNTTFFEILNHVIANSKTGLDNETKANETYEKDIREGNSTITTQNTSACATPIRSTSIPSTSSTTTKPSTSTITETVTPNTNLTVSTNSPKGSDPCDKMLEMIPDGTGNGTRNVSFCSLLKEIEKKANMTPITTGTSPHTGHHVTDTKRDDSSKPSSKTPLELLVTEVKFGVSGLNNIPVAPWEGGQWTPLLIDTHVTNSTLLKNVSRVFKELRTETVVDNVTLMVFADTVKQMYTDNSFKSETDDMKRDVFSDIMQISEHLLGKVYDPGNDIHVDTDTLHLRSTSVKPDANSTEVVLYLPKDFVDTEATRSRIQVTLSRTIFTNECLAEIRVATVLYKNMDGLIKGSNRHISSPVMSVSITYITGNKSESTAIQTKDAITFDIPTVVVTEKKEDKRMCTHWSPDKREWTSSGCDVVTYNSTHTTCKCNHLTSFAVLVMYIETPNITLGNQQALFALTTVGCSISIACLAMALIAYVYLKMLHNEKILIHANLSIALMLAQLVFVASSDAYKNKMACKVVAVLLHFLFMASFTWMMVEGVALYLCCTKGIFNHKDMRLKYFLLGWGVPAIIVVISFAAEFPKYGKGPQYSCWLSVHDGLIWAFLGPMLLIVLMNFIVMGLVVKVFLTLKANSQKTEVARLRGSVRAMLTLLPLLGLTWILSLLVPISVVFHYFFVIINTVQGMCIFFLHCICNDEIRRKFREKRKRWSTTRTASDADMSYPSRRKRGSFDAIKAASASTSAVAAEYARRSAWT